MEVVYVMWASLPTPTARTARVGILAWTARSVLRATVMGPARTDSAAMAAVCVKTPSMLRPTAATACPGTTVRSACYPALAVRGRCAATTVCVMMGLMVWVDAAARRVMWG